MSAIGLHYPSLFQDEAWLKAALLYWPKLARLDLARPSEDCGAGRGDHAGDSISSRLPAPPPPAAVPGPRRGLSRYWPRRG